MNKEGSASYELDEYRKIILDASPLACDVWDENMNMVDCNEAALQLFNVSSKKEYCANIQKLSAPIQEGGRLAGELAAEYVNEAIKSGKITFMWMHQKLNGEPIPAEVTLKKVTYKNTFRVLGYMRDLRLELSVKAETQEAEERNKLMLDASPLAVNIWNEQMDIIDCNEASVELFKCTSKKEYCEKFFELLSPPTQPSGRATREMVLEYVGTAIKTGEISFSWMHQTLYGERLPSEVTLKKVAYKDTFRIIGYVRDMRAELAARAEAEEANERNQLMINATPICFTFWDEKGNLIDCNDAALSMFELDDKQIFIQNFFALSPEYQEDGRLSKEAHLQDNNYALEHGSYVVEWMHQTLNGKKIPTEVTLIRVNYQDSYRIAGFTRDLREQKAMMAELEDAKSIAENSAKAKSDFLSNMSHEIRTPMNAIIGMTKIGQSSNDVEKMKYCLGKVNDASKQLLALINDILDMSKIDANKLELRHEPFNFEKMLENISNVIAVKAEEKKINLFVNLETKVPRFVISDELRLSQVITNFLSNAIKFTPDNGNVQLNIKQQSSTEHDSVIYVEVVDTGIGISPENMEKLFMSFEQAEGNITRRFGGTGLGLAISKKIVELMGGEVGVTSELDRGSCFYFTVKLQHDDKTDLDFLNQPLCKNLKVLVIDDDQSILDYFDAMMAELGIYCDLVNSGEAAIALILAENHKNSPYDIVFVDYFMEGMDGVETAKKIKNISGTSSNIIMISMSEWSSVEKKAKEAGIATFIQKPLFQSSILSAIHNLVVHKDALEPHNELPRKLQETFSRCSLLLAEDIEINREIAITLLEDIKINIECAENGKEAFEMFKANQNKYDIILMDIQMPVMDGLTASRLIRALGTEQAKTIPIVAMTANAFKEDVEACKNAGMVDHIGKPIDIDELIGKVSKYLSGKED